MIINIIITILGCLSLILGLFVLTSIALRIWSCIRAEVAFDIPVYHMLLLAIGWAGFIFYLVR